MDSHEREVVHLRREFVKIGIYAGLLLTLLDPTCPLCDHASDEIWKKAKFVVTKSERMWNLWSRNLKECNICEGILVVAFSVHLILYMEHVMWFSNHECHSWLKRYVRHFVEYKYKKNNTIVKLCPFFWNTTTVVVHFACASPWVFTISITKPANHYVHPWTGGQEICSWNREVDA